MKMYDIYERLLKERGLTNYKVSKATGISQPALSQWKRTGNPPKIERLKRIAEYLGVSIDYLTGSKCDDDPAIVFKAYTKEQNELIKLSANMDKNQIEHLLSYARFLNSEGKANED